MSPPSFLKKLAPELRVFVYDHVFGPSKAIKPENNTSSLGIDNQRAVPLGREQIRLTSVECSILATNKLIFWEAIQVLYHNKTVRATFPELKKSLQHKDFP
jgi:hypothetical protein